MSWQVIPATAGVIVCLALFLVMPAMAQSTAAWPIAPERMILNWGLDNRERRVVFDKDGIALELDVRVLMVGRDRIAIDANLPEAGSFQITLAQQTDIKLVRSENSGGSDQYELRSQFKVLGPKDLADRIEAETDELLNAGIERGREDFRNRSRGTAEAFLREQYSLRGFDNFKPPQDLQQLEKMYARMWAEKYASDPIREPLNNLLERHADWASEKEQARDLPRSGWQPVALFNELRELELIHEHLTASGFGPAADDRGAPKRLVPRFDAIYLIMSGNAARKTRGRKSASEVLSVAQLKKLRQMLTADLKCRFALSADDEDQNVKWCDAQRIACRAAGPISRVQGRLTPGDHNRIDWWRLDRWDPGQTALDLPKLTAVKFEQYPIEGALLLRVIATQSEPVDYEFAVKPKGKVATDTMITIYETPVSGDATFPY